MDYESYSIPYYAPEQDIPAKLPSREEIQHATDILSDSTGARVVGVTTHFVVKYGHRVSLQEGLVMVFLKKTRVVPVPKIYAIYDMTEDENKYIVMERIEGERLDLVWSSLKLTEKEAVASQLKNIFTDLRQLPSPGGFCSLNRQPLRDYIFNTESSEDSLQAPFETERELNDAMIRKYLSSGYLPPQKASFYRRAFPSIFTGHRPTFTHGDLQRKKILWSRKGGSITIIDWEFAGWYPSYWEYAKAIFGCSRWDDDWHEWIDYSLDLYRNEWVWIQMLILELWS